MLRDGWRLKLSPQIEGNPPTVILDEQVKCSVVVHIGELRVRNLETFDFTVSVTPEGATEAMDVAFRQQFYTE